MSNADSRTFKADGIANRMYIDVFIHNRLKYIKASALWDTGATSTHISQRVVDYLALPVHDTKEYTSASDKYTTTRHKINVNVAGIAVFNDIIVSKLKPGVNNGDMIIGMDLICKFDSAITTLNGDTLFSIRYPSKASIDFINEP